MSSKKSRGWLAGLGLCCCPLALAAEEVSVQQILDAIRPPGVQASYEKPTTIVRPRSHDSATEKSSAAYTQAAQLWNVPLPSTHQDTPKFNPKTWMPEPEASSAYRAVTQDKNGQARSNQQMLSNIEYPQASTGTSPDRALSHRPQHSSDAAAYLTTTHKRRAAKQPRVSRIPKARAHVVYGFDLARRGAALSAEQEFTDALWAVVQTKDSLQSTTRYAESLKRAFITLEEAGQFAAACRETDVPQAVSKIAAEHKSGVARNVIRDRMDAVAAMQLYLLAARLDFVEAVDGDPISSQALFGLARSYLARPSATAISDNMSGAKAMALLLAAHQIDKDNHKVSNELGVMYARYGDVANAELMMKRSLVTAEHVESWHNLSKVWSIAGKDELSQYAQRRARQLKDAGRGTPAAKVRLVPPEELIASVPTGHDFNAAQAAVPQVSSPVSQGVAQKQNWFQKLWNQGPLSVANKPSNTARR